MSYRTRGGNFHPQPPYCEHCHKYVSNLKRHKATKTHHEVAAGYKRKTKR